MYSVLFLMMIFGHLLADYPLQGDFLAQAKNHKKPIVGVPWSVALVSHAGIQAGFAVGMFILWSLMFMPPEPWHMAGEWSATMTARTSVLFAVALPIFFFELIAHSVIDYWKCDGRFNFVTDQLWHLSCKMLYVIAVSAFFMQIDFLHP